MKPGKRCLSILLAVVMLCTLITPYMGVAEASEADKVTWIQSADDFPTEIAEGAVYALENDITLNEGQQIGMLAGVLDGQGHTITLSGSTLANKITGTVQNLGTAGTVTSDKWIGSFASNFSGVIQNCFTTASVTCTDWNYESAGFVGNMTGGIISNSFFAGNAGLTGVAFVAGGIMANLSHTVASSSGSMGNHFGISNPNESVHLNDCHKVGDYEDPVVSWADAIAVLNTEIPDTGFTWVLEGTLPSLKSNDEVVPPEPIDKTALEAAILDAQQYTDPSLYTEDSWNALQNAITEAETVFGNEAATQDEINEKETMLRNSIAGLTKVKPTQPVTLPTDGSVIEIGSATDWVKVFDGSTETEGSYYVLTDSITLGDGDYTWLMSPFNGVLDGQGHTITFNGSSRLFNFVDIGENGVVQNVHFTGTVGGQGPEGALGTDLKGAALNCSFDVKTITGGKSSGIARRLDGGVISNCYVKGSPDNAFVAEYRSGNILNSYWMEGLNNPVAAEVMNGSSSKTMAEMKSKEFVNLLNTNKGVNGIVWGQNADGYPHFGDDIYNPTPKPEPEDGAVVGFKPYNSTEIQLVENGELSVSPDFVNQFREAGTLSLPEYQVPEGGHIEWNTYETMPEYAVSVALENGTLYVDSVGETTIKAVLVKAEGSTEELASIHVTSTYAETEALQLYIDGTEVTDGSYTVQGSEDKSIQIKARYAGKEEFVDVSSAGYSFEADHPDYLYQYTNGSYFSFAKPETVTITVTSKADESITAAVKLISEYVPVESIKPGISGTITVHGRNANDWQNSPPRFNPDYSGVIVEPANASNNRRENWSVTSSDDSIANYTETAYNAAKEGTVTFTAAIQDTDPKTGKTKEVSGTSEVTYVYQNPLVSVTGSEEDLVLKNNTEMPLELEFTGKMAKEDYSITEPSLNWTYDKEGIVRISRTNGSGYWKRDESVQNAKDYGMFLIDEKYTVHAIGEGTVTATGTPVDTTGGAKPVVVKIKVTEGEALPEVDIDQLVKENLENTIQNVKKLEPAEGYVFGQEWEVFSLIRAGEKIDTECLDHYYNSVAKALKEWDEEYGKPTDLERVALALTAMGKDITNIEGINLAEMIYNNPYLQNGSNELNFALIALDAARIEIPKDAKWERDSIIDKILTFQNENGGFGLYDNKYTSVDSTAMALQALSPYMEGWEVKRALKRDVNKAVEKGLEYLKSQLSDTYGYATSEADSQVILTLAVLGMDPLKVGFGTESQNIFTHLTDTYATEDGFSHVEGGKVTQMSTLQALQGFEAYRRYVAGEKAFWDLPSIGNSNPGEDLTQAERVKKAIDNLPSIGKITLKDEEKIVKVRSLYDGLTDKEKKEVSNYQKLLDAERRIQELKEQPVEEIKVNFTLYGASKEEIADSSRPTRKETWIEKTEVIVPKDSTVYDVFHKVLSENGIEYEERTNYIVGIKSPVTGEWLKEFINGPRSGWMYEVNGVYVEEGLRDKIVQNGDEVVWRYVNDFTDKDDSQKNEQAAEEADALILAIGEVTLDSKPAIDAARAAYDRLTPEQKKLVKEYNTLQLAEAQYEILKAESEKEYALTCEGIPVVISGKYLSGCELKIERLTAEDKDVVLMQKETPKDQFIAGLYHIKLMKDGKEVKPQESVKLNLNIGQQYNGREMTVLHVVESKKQGLFREKTAKEVEKLTGTVKDGVLTVKADTLGKFGVIVDMVKGEETKPEQKPGGGGAGTGGTGTTAEERLAKIVKYLQDHVTNPVVDTLGGEWSVIAMARADALLDDETLPEETKEKYLANLYQTLEDKDGVLDKRKYTEYARVALALTAIGVEPDMVNGYNILLPLAELENVKWQGVNGPIWALIALDSHDYVIPELPIKKKEKYTQTTRENLLEAILEKQLADGGWSLSGNKSDADMTAMAIQALAPYYGSDINVTNAVDRALDTLSSLQKDNGGFASYNTENLESAAQTVIALSILNVDLLSDERFVKNGNSVLDYLLSYQLADGSFKHTPEDTAADAMSTDQGALALTAYVRALNEQNDLFDMSDVEFGDKDKEEAAEKVEAFKRRMDALPNVSDIRMKDQQAVFALMSELNQMGTFEEKDDFRKELQKKLAEIEKQTKEVEQLDKDIWDKINPVSVTKEDASTVKALMESYNNIPEENRQYLKNREDLLKANEIIEKLLKEEQVSPEESGKDSEKEPEKDLIQKPEKDQGKTSGTVVKGKGTTNVKSGSNRRTASNTIKAKIENGVVDKSQIEAIEGTKKNLQMSGRMKDGTEYTLTLNGEDVKKSGDINTGVSRKSPYEEEVKLLAEEPYILEFAQKGNFPGKILVNVGVDLSEGEYLLLYYNPDEKKAEYIQKIEVGDKKTKFLIEKGGTYFIAKKVSTESVDELGAKPKAALLDVNSGEAALQGMNEGDTAVTSYVIAGICAVCLGIGAIAYLIYRKKRNGIAPEEDGQENE